MIWLRLTIIRWSLCERSLSPILQLCFGRFFTSIRSINIPLNVDYDLAFLVKAVGFEEIEIEARFASACLLEPEMNIFLDHFGTALESILQNLTGSVRDVNFASSEEKQRILVELNAIRPSGTSLSPANNVIELIEVQACKTPQRIAACQVPSV
jgi:hypothetical protein